ncbi:hypothetical protein ACJJTC_019106 [Scirpophaga incertulas]
MATKQEKELLINILEIYKEMPYLWNKNDPNYKNKTMRYEGFRVLLEMYKNFDPEATMKTIKKRIENMRSTYLKEVKKVNASKHTGAGSQDIYVPSLWYFDNLSFLESTTESCRPLLDTMEKDHNENSSSSEEERSEINSQARPSSAVPVPIKKKKTILEKQNTILITAEKLLTMKEEEWEVIGKSIGLQLRDLKRKELTIAQKLIADIIYYAKMGRITEDTHIVLGQTSFPSPISPSHSNTTDHSSSSFSSYFKINQLTQASHQNHAHSTHPSPQFYKLSPRNRIQSPHFSPQNHPGLSPQYQNPSPSQYNVQSLSPPQYHVQSPQASPQQHIQNSAQFLAQEDLPQIHIPDNDLPSVSEEIELQSFPTSQSSQPTQNDLNSSRINIKEYLIIKPKK